MASARRSPATSVRFRGSRSRLRSVSPASRWRASARSQSVSIRRSSTRSSTSSPRQVISPRSVRTRSRCRRRPSTTMVGSSATGSGRGSRSAATNAWTIGAVYGFGQREGLSDYLISLEAFDERFTEIADNQVYVTARSGGGGRRREARDRGGAGELPGCRGQRSIGIEGSDLVADRPAARDGLRPAVPRDRSSRCSAS